MINGQHQCFWCIAAKLYSCTVLIVSISQVIGCEDRLRNDLYCVEWGVKLYSNPIQAVKLLWRRLSAAAYEYALLMLVG